MTDAADPTRASFALDPATLPRRARVVVDALRAAGADGEVRQFDESTHTAAQAAAALGCEVGAIASSLVFRLGDAPLLVLTSGAHRVDTALVAATLERGQITRADADFVTRVTGQIIGGVAPVGHPEPILTLVDTALAAHEVVWASAGSSNSVFATTFEELVRLTGGAPTRVADDELSPR
ncbi:YbaK/EbsC family protein [Frigoribacterium sp. 2-23]|uniref:YbaK/EbsC family protein n=1 Tax=Frigoribacterium sp. 2-23 TaxID=3415006 RepID=UPI003C6FB2A5